MLAARIATASVLIAALLAALFLLPRAWLAVLMAGVAGAGAIEWARLCRVGRGGAWIYGLATAIACGALYNTEPWHGVFALATFFWLVAVPAWLWRGVRQGQETLLLAAGFVVLLPTALAVVALRPAEVLGVLGLVWIADTGAYFAGRAFGRRKLAPAISPGKTVEGALGGLAGAIAYAIICGILLERISWVPFLGAALLLAALSIIGDLFESAAKRQAGAKDSGTLLPGHGGILDRIDSATATLPVAALVWPLLAIRG